MPTSAELTPTTNREGLLHLRRLGLSDYDTGLAGDAGFHGYPR